MTSLCFRFFASLLLFAFLGFAGAQSSAPPTEKDKKDQKSILLVKPGKPGTPAKTEAKASPRLQKLKQLPFDRRPSVILKAWAPQSPPEPKADAPKPDPLDKEMTALQRQVTLGLWADIKKYLAGLPKEEAKAGYAQMLLSLQSGPPIGPPQPGMPMIPAMVQYAERNQFSPDDLVGLAAAAPKGLDKDTLHGLGAILRQSVAGGTVVKAIVARLKAETARPSAAALTARQAAHLLTDAGQAAESGVFLPPLDKAKSDKDVEALNLLAKHFAGLHARENKLALLEKAWDATQAALAIEPRKDRRADQENALREAVELAPKLRAELGQAWLERGFTHEPQRGMNILATIGALAAPGLATQPFNPDGRFKTLELLKNAVEALLKAAPDRAKEWRDTLTLLGGIWLKEGEFSYQFAQGSGAAHMRRDRFGNIYFMNDGTMNPYQQMNPNQPRPIAVVDVLKARPNPDWLDRVRDDLRPKLAMTLCQLHLKADEEAKAFPYIEQLAPTHPRQARELVDEFLRVWTRNHDPNAAKSYTNPYMFMFGFERRAEGIPLTRSKQERNLVDLAGWVTRLHKLPIGDPDEQLLAKAFTACHSTAEVYRAEAIEKVFGPLGGLKPKTLAGLIQQMRENLAGIWRKPDEQNAKKTNRKTKDIRAEVLRGYEVAGEVVADALKKYPDDWSLILARAAVLHDEVNYHRELHKTADFAPKLNNVFAEFQRAAKRYAAKVKDLPEEEQSTKVYEQWLYASLGACDLGTIDETKVPNPRQPARIRAALAALPGEAAEKHRAKFANLLFTRLSAVKPAVKYRYLKAGFEIIGDHEQAVEAKKVFDYYKDLVREIKLESVIDGSAVVGHTQPFGVYVFLRHTREIERESGGFGRYLQNQNSSANMMFSYNYGRPTADYRDRFQTAATEALKKHFDVLSVTFETDKVHSRAAKAYGWRITPYAYLLLKPRGPQVDKLPPLHIDLDFLDTSGYAVLPVESPAVPLDAKPERGEPRPARKLQIAQILDERQAANGKLILEIKATALGLVPELDQLLSLHPDGFDIVATEDQGVSVSKFDGESNDIAVSSERTWMVTLHASPDRTPPRVFQFGQSKIGDAKMLYQRFNDADLVAVEREVSLEQQYDGRGSRWLRWLSGTAIGLLVLALVVFFLLRRPKARGASPWKLPEPLTPFTVIGLLEKIHQEGALNAEQQAEVRQAIGRLERRYFAAETNGDGRLDLKEIGEGWLRILSAR